MDTVDHGLGLKRKRDRSGDSDKENQSPPKKPRLEIEDASLHTPPIGSVATTTTTALPEVLPSRPLGLHRSQSPDERPGTATQKIIDKYPTLKGKIKSKQPPQTTHEKPRTEAGPSDQSPTTSVLQAKEHQSNTVSSTFTLEVTESENPQSISPSLKRKAEDDSSTQALPSKIIKITTAKDVSGDREKSGTIKDLENKQTKLLNKLGFASLSAFLDTYPGGTFDECVAKWQAEHPKPKTATVRPKAVQKPRPQTRNPPRKVESKTQRELAKKKESADVDIRASVHESSNAASSSNSPITVKTGTAAGLKPHPYAHKIMTNGSKEHHRTSSHGLPDLEENDELVIVQASPSDHGKTASKAAKQETGQAHGQVEQDAVSTHSNEANSRLAKDSNEETQIDSAMKDTTGDEQVQAKSGVESEASARPEPVATTSDVEIFKAWQAKLMAKAAKIARASGQPRADYEESQQSASSTLRQQMQAQTVTPRQEATRPASLHTSQRQSAQAQQPIAAAQYTPQPRPSALTQPATRSCPPSQPQSLPTTRQPAPSQASTAVPSSAAMQSVAPPRQRASAQPQSRREDREGVQYAPPIEYWSPPRRHRGNGLTWKQAEKKFLPGMHKRRN